MKNLVVVLSVLLLGGCTGGNDAPEEVRSYDLLNIKEEMTLKFSDLVEDIRIVPLESGSDFLIPDSDYLISDKYIITLNKDAIHQFDAQTGKHIRLLAVAGNGPREFNYLNSFCILNDRLYYSMSGKDNLYVVDLNTGVHAEPYPTRYTYFRFEEVSEAEELYVANDSLLFERYDFKTHEKKFLIDTLKKRIRAVPNGGSFILGGSSMNGSYVLKNKEERFYYHKKYSDTLYRDTPTGILPYACLNLPADKMSASTEQGFPNGKQFRIKLPYVGSDKVFCSVLALDILSSGNSISATIVPQGLYCIHRKNGEAKIVKRYLFDPLFEYEFVDGENQQGEVTYLASVVFGFHNYAVSKDTYAVAISAYKVKEYIRLSLENEDFPDNKKALLRELDQKLSDEGNPVVFIGKKK